MAMTIADIYGEVRENIKRTVTAVSNERIIRWVNWAQGYLTDLHTYEEMREIYSGATIDGTPRYGFPDQMKDVYSMTLQDGSSSRVLTYTPARRFDHVVPRPATYSENAGGAYVDYGTNFQVFPIPDAAYSLVLRCSIYPTDFATDGTVTTTDELGILRKDALVCAVTTTFGFWMLKEVEDAAYWGSNLVPSLYDASLATDHSAEDWIPVARGFSTVGRATPIGSGNWWTNPFTGRG